MRYKLLFCFLFISIQFVMVFSQSFTERELEIIQSKDENGSFRILQTTDRVDSIILRMQSEDIDADSITGNDNLQLLIKRLQTTLYESGGVGIAATLFAIHGLMLNILMTRATTVWSILKDIAGLKTLLQ
ncbi:MAG: hypothetical protein PHW97_01255 [Fermentimonas sp.]|nr:hypothetical protein [Fermentimonas sp.]MDD3510509.1 hypothetical protein [Fermentimonas sp.]